MEFNFIWHLIFASGIILMSSVLVLHFFFLDSIIDNEIGRELALRNGSAAWERWVNLPVPIVLKVYLFEVINPKDVSFGKKPIVKERGPYIYREIRRKKNIVVNSVADTISYDQETLFYFDKEKSGNFSENDQVTVINPAIMIIINTLYNIKPLQFIADFFDFAIPSMFNSPESVFLTTSVKKLLFEGELIKCSQEEPNLETLLVCSALKNLLPMKVLRMVDNGDMSFALLRHKNGTDSETNKLEIRSGIKEPKLLGQILKWNKVSELSVWSGNPCNYIRGNEMTLITPYQSSDSRLTLFSTDICCSVILEYNKNIIYEDIPGLRFTFSPSFLESATKYPQNYCFCNVTVKGLTTPSTCLPKGALDISGCIDVPVILTKPHFMDTDSKYVTGVDGLKPDYKKHLTFLDIEPRTGIPLQGYQRVQFNVEMTNISTITIMEKLPNVLFPLIWIEEGTQLRKTETDMLKDMIINKLHLLNTAILIFIVITILIILLSIVIIYKNNYKKKKC